MERRCMGLFLLSLLVLASQEAVEGRMCRTRSEKYKGVCINSGNCSTVCQGEGFEDGKCTGFGLKRRCFCMRPCGGDSGGGSGGGGSGGGGGDDPPPGGELPPPGWELPPPFGKRPPPARTAWVN